jgi:hypothetical protein
VESSFNDVVQESLAARAALESRALYDLIEVVQNVGFVFSCFANPGNSRRVSITVEFPRHCNLPTPMRISHRGAVRTQAVSDREPRAKAQGRKLRSPTKVVRTRDSESGFFESQAAEVDEFDEASLPRIPLGEARERLIKDEHVVGSGGDGDEEVRESQPGGGRRYVCRLCAGARDRRAPSA